MTPRARLALPALVTAAALLAAATLHVMDPNEPGNYPLCPFLALTGWYCPGCGSLRAVRALAMLDLGTAWARNPLTTLAVLGLVVWFLTWVRRRWLDLPRRTLPPAWAVYGLAVLVVVFGVVRNLPGMALLSPV